MNLKKIVRNFFGFSRAETNGFLVLAPLLLLLLFSEPLYRNWMIRNKMDSAADQRLLDSLVAMWQKSDSLKVEVANTERRFFAFDPHTVSKDELLELGFSDMLANRMVNYVAKGGRFRVKKDLLKIYGMDTTLFEELRTYLLLPDSSIRTKKENVFTKNAKPARSLPASFDLNKADTSQLKSIYGIGEKLSLRIIKYRESLGGFIRHDQVQEVYGLDSAVIHNLLKRSFLDPAFKPAKLNINAATEEVLDKHPYLSRKEAKAISTYRFQHGAFTSVEELQKIQVLEKSTFEKIRPYLSVN